MSAPRMGIASIADSSGKRAENRRETTRRLIGELAPYRHAFMVAFVLIIISASAQAIGPWLVGRAIDRAIMRGNAGLLERMMILFVLVYIVGTFASRGQIQRVGTAGQRMLADLRVRLFARLERLPLQYFARHPIGDLMSRVVNDVDTLNQLFSGGLTQLLGSLASLSGIIIAMFVLDIRLALASVTVIPVMLLATKFFARKARNAFRTSRETTGDITAGLEQEIIGVREAQAFARTESNNVRFRAQNAANREAGVRAVAITSAFAPTIDVLSTLAITIVIGYGGWRALHGEITVGLLASFLIYVQQFFRPLQMAATVYTQAQSAVAGAERIYQVLDEPEEPMDETGALVLARVSGQIDFEHVNFAYDIGRPVLHDVTFTAKPGMTVALVGETGAGKTTMASLIPRFYDVTDGVVRLDGRDVRAVGRRSVRDQIAIVLQDPFIFSGTISENICYGKPDATTAEIERAAQTVHAHPFILELGKGYATLLGEGGEALSRGQRQLIAAARAVLTDRPILILDEATSSVDSRTERLLQAGLATLMAGRTSIVIAHRLSTIRDADLILVLSEGRIVERGTHEELMELDGVYAMLYRRQFGGIQHDSAPAIER